MKIAKQHNNALNAISTLNAKNSKNVVIPITRQKI
jgi:hypothetical protein